MNESDLTGIDKDLQKLKPAEPPPAFMSRLLSAAESAARPRFETRKCIARDFRFGGKGMIKGTLCRVSGRGEDDCFARYSY